MLDKNKIKDRIFVLMQEAREKELESLKNPYTSYGYQCNIDKLKLIASIEELKLVLNDSYGV